MSDDGESNVVEFRRLDSSPSAQLKRLDITDKKRSCQHKKVHIWVSEPILECKDCGAIVDPYWWMRQTIGSWSSIYDGIKFQENEARKELEALKREIRKLRREFKDEAERQAPDREIMRLPPSRKVSP
jgi:hypothetical protein